MRRGIGIVVGLALIIALSVSPTALADGSHEIKVLGSNGKVVATFHSAKCTKNKHGFFARARRDNGSNLFVRVEEFTGFHDYKLVYGNNADPYASFQNKDQVAYSNLNKPPFPSPGGGELRFAKHGKLMGVGFNLAYSDDGSDAVTFTGVARCRYRR